jgi:hypothetical protein
MRTMIAIATLAAALLAAPVLATQPPAETAPAGDTINAAVVRMPATRLSTATGIRTLLADPKAKEVLVRHAPQVVEFFASGQSEGIAPGDTPLDAIARIPQVQDAGLTAANMQKIADELAAF